MAQYRFLCQAGEEGKKVNLTGVRIVHNQAICQGHGLQCDFPGVITTTTTNGAATIAMPNTVMNHWFQATYPLTPPRTILESNSYTGEFGGYRDIQFDFYTP